MVFSRSCLALVVVLVVGAWACEARAQCPVGQEIRVDNDISGSGYSEIQPENWETWGTNACHGTYRYTSHTVGDGSREGKAVWNPAIQVEGWYEVTTGYRLTENRTTHADYYVYDDAGTVDHTVIDQYVADRDDANCEYRTLGTFFCRPGGNCRVELDSTDGYDSPAADITTFELVRCDDAGADAGSGDTGGGGDAGVSARCDGIRQNTNYELCGETSTTCAGVFTDGSGCEAFCAAAGMDCVAKYGGEPGCQKEADYVLTCGEATGHDSDWCECEGPPLDSPDTGSSDTGSTDTGPVDTGSSDGGEEDSSSDIGSGDTQGQPDSAASDTESPSDGASEEESRQDTDGVVSSTGQGSCSCRVVGADRRSTGWVMVGLFVVVAARRSWHG